MPRWLRYSIVLGIAALVVVLMLSFRRDPHDIRTGTVNKPAAAFTADKLDSTGTLSLKDYAGKVVVLNFFASWCNPCIRELPALQAMSQRYKGRVHFVGVTFSDRREAAKSVLDRAGVEYPAAFDPSMSDVAYDYAVRVMPTTFFIGADGNLVERKDGEINEVQLRTVIDRLF